MVDGFQKLRGNAPVKPVPWQPPGSAHRRRRIGGRRGGRVAGASGARR